MVKDVKLLGGDVTLDDTINIRDITALIAVYNTNDASADVNGSGTVDIRDLTVLLGNYGKTAVAE